MLWGTAWLCCLLASPAGLAQTPAAPGEAPAIEAPARQTQVPQGLTSFSMEVLLGLKKGNQIQVQINLEAARVAGIKVSSRLLSVATLVDSTSEARN